MKKVILLSAVSAFGIMTSTTATANDDDGFYVRGNVGYGTHQEDGITGDITSNVHAVGVESEGNGAISAGVGYDFGSNWRLELDGDTLFTDLGSIASLPSSSAKVRTNTLMLNAIYDFEDLGRWEPFVGAGVGLVNGRASLTAHDYVPDGTNLLVSPACIGPRTLGQAETCDISDSDTGFGWQLLAGLGYAVTENLTWDTHYTYLNGPNLDLEGFRTNGVTGTSAPINATLQDIRAHSVVTGLRYKFGHNHAPEPVAFTPPPPPPAPTFTCWNGDIVETSGQCPARPAPAPAPTYACWDGSQTFDLATCPAQPAPAPAPTYTCWDNSVTYDLATCPAQPVPQRANLNLCGESAVAIFNVPTGKTPKQMSRLGTLPEFGDSHSLSPTQFYEKLNARYSDNATDKAYLNYLFKSMGYSNGWADAQPYMFSDEVLPVGTRGLLGLGKQHHYNYSILPSNDRDRQAFRIQSANGSVVHFMKTCGNYMYACECGCPSTNINQS